MLLDYFFSPIHLSKYSNQGLKDHHNLFVHATIIKRKTLQRKKAIMINLTIKFNVHLYLIAIHGDIFDDFLISLMMKWRP